MKTYVVEVYNHDDKDFEVEADTAEEAFVDAAFIIAENGPRYGYEGPMKTPDTQPAVFIAISDKANNMDDLSEGEVYFLNAVGHVEGGTMIADVSDDGKATFSECATYHAVEINDEPERESPAALTMLPEYSQCQAASREHAAAMILDSNPSLQGVWVYDDHGGFPWLGSAEHFRSDMVVCPDLAAARSITHTEI